MKKLIYRIQSTRRGLMLFCALGAPLMGFSQIDFQEIREMNSMFPYEGTIETVDIDLDGDMDFLMMGRSHASGIYTYVTKLFINDGTGIFSIMENTPFDGCYNGEADFADVDSDGDLDIIFVGENQSNGTPTSKLYLNQGNTSFTVSSPSPIPLLKEADVEFFDFNGDPYLDLFIAGTTGYYSNTQLTKIFTGDGKGNFQEVLDTGLDNLTIVDCSFGDVNNDGVEELILAGVRVVPSLEAGAYIYYKENGKYVKKGNISKLVGGDADLADLDHDGDLDYLITGRGGFIWKVEYYLNDGFGNFTEVLDHPFVPGAWLPKVVIEDFDLDEDLDIFISGANTHETGNFVYLNDGQGTFTINDYVFPGTRVLGSGVGNFDGKGLFDFIFFGAERQKAQLFLNNINLNTPPFVSDIEITGELLVDYELDAEYNFEDKEGEEDQSSFQWYRAEDALGNNSIQIAGANQKEYLVNSLDNGKFLRLEITPFDGEVSGTVVQSDWKGPITLPVPELLVSGNSISINNGDMETSILDHTHFGETKRTGTISKLYSLGNNGKADLIIGGISLEGGNPEDFSVIGPEVLSILPGGVMNFSVEFSPKGLGARTAIVNISSNDPQSSSFSFKISGEGLNSIPVFNSEASVNIIENSPGEILDVNSTDGEGGANDENILYAISGGEDQGLFNIDPASGSLRFISAPDYENPIDLNMDNEYIIEITSDDGGTGDHMAVQVIKVYVINDDELPIAVCKEGVTVSLDSNGEAVINAMDIDGGSTDDMGILNLSVKPDHFSCIDVGTVTVTLTVTDSGENSVSCTSTINVVNNSVAKVSSVSPIVVPSETGKCGASIAINAPMVTYNCGSWEAFGTRSDNLPLTDPFLLGETFIIWATDPSGTVGESVIQSVTVTDSEAPVFSPVQPVQMDNDAGRNGAYIKIENPVVTDCSNVTLTGTRKDGNELDDIFPIGETVINWTASDGTNNVVEIEQRVFVRDVEKPVIELPLDISVVSSGGNCGAYVKITPPLVTDNSGVSSPPVGTREDMASLDDIFPVGETRIKWTATDINNNEANEVYQLVKVSIRQPDEIKISGPVAPQIIGTAIELTADFNDENFVEANWKIFNGSEIFQEAPGIQIAQDERQVSHRFEGLPAGVYTVSVDLTYNCGKVVSKDFEYVVIYDPNGGFVTGGGWILSPAGAMRDPVKSTIEGRANFGFNAKYKSGKNEIDQVGGETNFQFRTGDFYFKSSSHEAMSLIISGGFKATYKGVGELNGEEGYNFMISVIDAEETVNYPIDLFRIKIWRGESVIYDNNLKNPGEDAEPATSIGGGSIVIHKPKDAIKTANLEVLTFEENEINKEPELFIVYPNPMESKATIEFILNISTNAILSLYDLNGREVKRLFDGKVEQDKVYITEFLKGNMMGGTYIYRLTTGVGEIYQKQLIIK